MAREVKAYSLNLSAVPAGELSLPLVLRPVPPLLTLPVAHTAGGRLGGQCAEQSGPRPRTQSPVLSVPATSRAPKVQNPIKFSL